MQQTEQTFQQKLESFRAAVEAQSRDEYRKVICNGKEPSNPDLLTSACVTSLKPGRKYTKVDVGTGGRYMVVNATGEIFGIKAYGVIHRSHRYGTLDTMAELHWGGYYGVRRVKPATAAAESAIKVEREPVEVLKARCPLLAAHLDSIGVVAIVTIASDVTAAMYHESGRYQKRFVSGSKALYERYVREIR